MPLSTSSPQLDEGHVKHSMPQSTLSTQLEEELAALAAVSRLRTLIELPVLDRST